MIPAEHSVNKPWNGLNKVVFGGVLAEAWDRSANVDSAVSGFRSCGIFPFSPNQHPDHVFCPGTMCTVKSQW
jgi:hypothetical protein